MSVLTAFTQHTALSFNQYRQEKKKKKSMVIRREKKKKPAPTCKWPNYLHRKSSKIYAKDLI